MKYHFLDHATQTRSAQSRSTFGFLDPVLLAVTSCIAFFLGSLPIHPFVFLYSSQLFFFADEVHYSRSPFVEVDMGHWGHADG